MKLTRRTVLAGLGTLAVAPLLTRALKARPKLDKPNLILFLADDMRYDAAGYLGNPYIQTPHLDELSKDSFIFDNSFVTTSICPCSRASIYSGDYMLRHGVTNFTDALQPQSFDHLFFRRMRAAGYYTGFVGKWGIGGNLPVRQFDYWDGFAGQGDYFNSKHEHVTDVQTQQALHFLNKAPTDKPFLLIIAYKAPHGPYIPQKRFEHLYEDTVIQRFHSDSRESIDNLPPFLGKPLQRGYNDASFKSFNNQARQYYQTITGIDDSLGQVISNLRDSSILDDTNIIFTSDNGMMLGAHGLWGKWYMFEESIRVPLLIRPAKRFFTQLKPTHVETPALNIDMARTALSLSSVKVTDDYQGKDLMPAMQSPGKSVRDGFFYEFYGMPNLYPCEGYRTRDWKFIRYYDTSSPKPIYDSLYDMKNDPQELEELGLNPKYKDRLTQMANLMTQEKVKLMHPGQHINTFPLAPLTNAPEKD